MKKTKSTKMSPAAAKHVGRVMSYVHDEKVARCAYCGKPLSRSDVNDYGTLCARCYQKEYEY
jgi:formylmethanofuran dehydrogenase subunit E